VKFFKGFPERVMRSGEPDAGTSYTLFAKKRLLADGVFTIKTDWLKRGK
jgi:hypothetical protein